MDIYAYLLIICCAAILVLMILYLVSRANKDTRDFYDSLFCNHELTERIVLLEELNKVLKEQLDLAHKLNLKISETLCKED